ncbi:glycosyl hydrolase family 18 protein [Paraliobacillus sp. JSM ZJ581]|uniref:glycosyl hydrolase family 18 protein n=1 Tax=Paraliobacillus sp. JSM ZJ581 TaxID=3342118 RepID=UPI0035A8A58A
MNTFTLTRQRKSLIGLIFSILLVVSLILSYLVSGKTVFAANGSEKVVLGYYASWAPPKNLDANKITHLNYSFGDICWNGEHGNPANEEIPAGEQKVWACTDLDGKENKELPNGTIVLYDPETDLEELPKVEALKNKNPNLKTLLSVGGWTLSHNLSDVAADVEARKVFAQSAVDFVRKFNMDGLDIDWEWPGAEGHPGNAIRPEDGENYVKLLQTVRDAFDVAGKEDGQHYLVTIAGAQTWTFDTNNDLKAIGEIVDYAAIMTYDTNGTWSGLTGHNAPVYLDDLEAELRGWHSGSADSASNMYLWGGIPPEKVVLGVPFYGQVWEGCNANNNGAYNPKRGAYQECAAGKSDVLPSDGYNIIKPLVNQEGYKYYWDDVAKVPYLYNEDLGVFVSFDNVESLTEKTRLVKEKGLGGMMIWDLGTDDESWNLLKAVSYGLGVSNEPPTPDKKQYVAEVITEKSETATVSKVTLEFGDISTEGVSSYILYRDGKQVTEFALKDIVDGVISYSEEVEPGNEYVYTLAGIHADFKTEMEVAQVIVNAEAYDPGTDSGNGSVSDGNGKDGKVDGKEDADSNIDGGNDDEANNDARKDTNNEDSSPNDESEENDEAGIVYDKDDNGSNGDSLKLPNTATNMFNYIAIGALVILIGVITFFYHKRRERAHQ